MKFYEVTRHIAANPDTVWSTLTKREALLNNTGITRLDGTLTDGGKITLYSDVSPRPFKLRVKLDAPRKMIWSGGMPFGLFKGERTFTLTPQNDGTGFHMREEFSGPMLGMIWKSMPDLQPSFEKFADCITNQAEAA